MPRTPCKRGRRDSHTPGTLTKDGVLNSQTQFPWMEAAPLGEGKLASPTPIPPSSYLRDVCPAPFMSPAMLTLTWNKQTTVKDRSLDFEIRFHCQEQMSWWPNSVTKPMTYSMTTDLIKKKIQLNFKMPRKFGKKKEEETRLPGTHWVKV